jgi:hypothetical protein
VSPEYLEKIALDSKFSTDPVFGSNVQQISLFQENELAQAKNGDANFRLQKESAEKKFKKKQNKDRGVEDFEPGERLPNSFRLKENYQN